MDRKIPNDGQQEEVPQQEGEKSKAPSAEQAMKDMETLLNEVIDVASKRGYSVLIGFDLNGASIVGTNGSITSLLGMQRIAQADLEVSYLASKRASMQASAITNKARDGAGSSEQ